MGLQLPQCSRWKLRGDDDEDDETDDEMTCQDFGYFAKMFV